ncbi:Esterase SG1 [Chionoecetes opilio]|uniref:Esterase SG1 n=1 Tax=Chionoecetes opilio TaxID=41210 RepID=A0A8J4YBH6_CHIOP|nr:Esterase SG1 [Chionoecetes opilio]
MMIPLVTVVAMVVMVAAAEHPTVEVALKQGAITGFPEEVPNGRVYYSFKSIPYAMPPAGSLRFKDPEPGPTWSGVRNGSLSIPKCPQNNFMAAGTVAGQEDCLYLNVFTSRPYNSKLPVMVYIHGGGFLYGSAETLVRLQRH